MPGTSIRKHRVASLTVRVGDWFEAQATGWGVLAVPAVLALVVGAALVHALLV